MNRLLLAIVSALALGLSACAGWFTVDGFELRYVDRPTIEGHHRWVHRGLVVYEVDGRYYREQEHRWVEYRERPRDLQEERR
jgi:hypothetical protein